MIKNKADEGGIYVNEKVEFKFAHALSRIGFTVKAITDEVNAGGTPKPLDAATTIVLKKVVLYGGNRVTGNTVPTEANVNGIFYIEGTGSTAGTWLGSHADITAYYEGLTVAYKIPVKGASTTTLNINSLGATNVVK